jgi:MoaA/NifB/PqqE/SkfB family radical SAM enzyme
LSILFLEEASSIGVQEIVISGGEPTLHPKLKDILEEARKLGDWKVKLLTNGYLAGLPDGEALIRKISKYVDDIQVSLDGIDEETHDSIRGAGSYKNACKTINILSDANKAKVGISFTPLPENVQGIPKLFNLAMQLKANYIHLNRPKHPANNAYDANGQLLTCDFALKAFFPHTMN